MHPQVTTRPREGCGDFGEGGPAATNPENFHPQTRSRMAAATPLVGYRYRQSAHLLGQQLGALAGRGIPR